jgi:hypothetical protein
MIKIHKTLILRNILYGCFEAGFPTLRRGGTVRGCSEHRTEEKVSNLEIGYDSRMEFLEGLEPS